jgi:putative membrane protein
MKLFLTMAMVLLIPSLALAQFNNFHGNCWGSGMRMFHGGGGFMMMIFFAVILFLVFYFVKHLISRKDGDSESAIQILKERFAKGEITQTEYVEMKKLVRK